MPTKPPGGTRDFLPEEIRRREHVIGKVRSVYERYGFEPLETPAFENIETLLGKYGEEGNKLIFKILRRGEHEASGEADLALRYDLTVPLARVIAQYQQDLPKFFKRYQIQPVWRADRPAKGRFREFYQCDIDSIGSTSPVVEVEQLAAFSDTLTELGFKEFVIHLNHRRVLTALLTNVGIPAAQHGGVLTDLDKLDKIGWDGVEKSLAERGIDEANRSRLRDWIRTDDLPDRLSWLERQLVQMDVQERAAFQNLRDILQLASQTAAADKVRFSPSLARGLSYYTGATFEIGMKNLAGSLGGGGRYDNLIGMFLGRDVPACGFSLGLERIIAAMTEWDMFPVTVARGAIDVMITMWSDETRAEALTLAAELRRAGLRVDVYPEAEKLGKQFRYASTRHVPWVAIIGDDERARGEVAIKDMRSGDQQRVARADAARLIDRGLNPEP